MGIRGVSSLLFSGIEETIYIYMYLATFRCRFKPYIG